MGNESKARRICAGLFLVYGLVMVYLLFLQRTPPPISLKMHIEFSTNLIPLKTIRQQLRLLEGGAFVRFAFVNLVGNVVMFIPMGLLPGIWEKQRKFGRYVLTVALVIASIEVLQLLTMLGSADIDDWLLNVLGAVIGFELWRTVGKVFHLYQ